MYDKFHESLLVCKVKFCTFFFIIINQHFLNFFWKNRVLYPKVMEYNLEATGVSTKSSLDKQTECEEKIDQNEPVDECEEKKEQIEEMECEEKKDKTEPVDECEEKKDKTEPVDEF